MAKQFNNYFVTVAEKLTGQTNNKYQDYLKNPNEHSMHLTEVEPDEIKIQVKNLNSKKASDFFGISANFLKFAGDKIIQSLRILFNESIRNGILPEKLKLAVVYQVHKKVSKMKVNNYRPISILPMISKIYEKLIHASLMSFFTKNKTIHKCQFGFQKGKSTEHAILDIYASILKALENKEKACRIFLDFAKAFDTVNHEILLTKLEYYGVRGIAYELMKSYLRERLQCLKIRQTISDFRKITCRVPQGSVLEPLLFLIYINDIYKSDPIAEFHIFADDTALFCANKNINQLRNNINTSLDNVANWLKANKLTLNADKSKLLYFDLSPACKRDISDVYINGEPLEFTAKQNTLG